jgi:hypothetical protein
MALLAALGLGLARPTMASGADRAAATAGAPSTATPAANGWYALARWPDFTTGMWAENYNFKAPVKPQLTPQAQLLLQQKARSPEGGGTCRPLGMPGMLMPGYPMAFFYTKGSIFIMSDMDDLLVRHVFMDRSEHGDPDPAWNGHSIGHWDGDSLVIDTVAITAEAPLAGLPSGGKTHIIEHIRMTGPDTLEWRSRIINPDILAQPWEFTKTYVRHKDWELQPATCVEGNRDAPDASGNPHVDLTPPKK